MARTTVLLDDHTAALLTALSAAGFDIGDGQAPRNADKSEIDPPYAVLYPIPGGRFDGPISDSQADVVLQYQITSVGRTRQQAQVTLDVCRDLMKVANVTITGRRVRDLKHLTPHSGVMRDDDLPNPLFYGYDRYELDTTPA
ncbi:MAG: hypothetical protein R3330_05800 [Saprospiraceae bacterium]|nr:hypothetical protein [Saprospiraceae bacterium]